MKVVNIVTQMERGGAQAVALSLTGGLAQHGHVTELVFLYTKRDAFGSLPGIRSLFPASPHGAADYLRITWRLLCYLVRHRPDAVISHTHYSNVLVLPLAWLARIRIRIAVQHNPVSTYPAIVRMFDPFLGCTTIYAAIVGVSRVARDSVSGYPRRYRRKFRVIPNGIQATPRGLPTITVPVPPGHPVLISVGRLSRQKNHAVAIAALQHLENVHLLLVGDGELRSELGALSERLGLADRVHFIGEVSQDEVWAHLKAASVFVFPSLYECLPLALVEAMAAGVPVVASDIPAAREVLTLGDGAMAGLLVTPGDAPLLAKAIQALLADPIRARQLALRATQRARDYDLQTMVLGYHRLLEELTARHSVQRRAPASSDMQTRTC